MKQVFSADHFFERSGEYKFNLDFLGDAHNACLKGFLDAVRNTAPTKVYVMRGVPGSGKSSYVKNVTEGIVCDNTNIGVAELAPYVASALAYGHDVTVVRVLCDPAVAAARNVHGVPANVVKAKAEWLARSGNLPPYWKEIRIENTTKKE
jgi:hypothetical protein